MALSTRAKTMAGILAVVVLAGAAFVGYRLLTKAPDEPLIQNPFTAEPVVCPLTGEETEREKPAARRALAVKIENISEARPQAGLAEADVVYEQEAEGGITRFIAVYQCSDAPRLGPVRSARPVDAPVIQQLGDPLFVHAGSVQAVVNAIARAGLEDINCNQNPEPCPRDPARSAPHDVFTSTRTLYRAGGGGDPPEPLFTYDEDLERRGSRRGRELHLDFSPAADVLWRYERAGNRYLRFHGETPHTVESGDQVAATNVVVQLVDRTSTRITDAAGNTVPNYDVIGRGEAIVFRNGRAIVGTWHRGSPDEITTFLNRRGEEIALAPGTTWVELFPTDAPAPPEFS
ncbi:MAG: DUF3048 domain-containing protein [Actinomycetota bacterium]